jgi:hypothetical protein
MKKQVLTILFIIAFTINCFGQNNSPEGKTFIREVSKACKMFNDGGCLITNYHTMTFTQDSVFVNYHTKADSDIPSRKELYEKNAGEIGAYSYQKHKKRNSSNYIIRINGYEVSGFEAFPDKLVEFINDPNYPEANKVVFELQK